MIADLKSKHLVIWLLILCLWFSYSCDNGQCSISCIETWTTSNLAYWSCFCWKCCSTVLLHAVSMYTSCRSSCKLICRKLITELTETAMHMEACMHVDAPWLCCCRTSSIWCWDLSSVCGLLCPSALLGLHQTEPHPFVPFNHQEADTPCCCCCRNSSTGCCDCSSMCGLLCPHALVGLH